MAGKMVEFPTNGHTTQGYLATPASGKGPGVIVIQEWWGLVPHIKNVADRFAAEGFSALAPDMYHGQTASEPDTAGKLFMALNIEQAEKDLRGATTYLKGHSSTTKIGVVGFCMGGQLALLTATLDPSIGACVNFYGIHPNVKPDYRKLAGPVLGLYAEKDGFVTPEVAKGVDKAIKGAGKSSEIHIYPGVDHGFFNDDRPDVHAKPSAEDAWKRTLAFFRQHVK
jgi:carboxymethylenebutenolidase